MRKYYKVKPQNEVALKNYLNVDKKIKNDERHNTNSNSKCRCNRNITCKCKWLAYTYFAGLCDMLHNLEVYKR